MVLETFLLAFVLLLLIVLGMSLGVILMGKNIKGSCGGLNAISGSDKCVVCKKDVDPNSPLRDKLECKRAQDILDCICMDEKIFQALGAVEQLTKAAPMETPPTYVLTLLKNGPGSHIKARV